MVVFGMRASGGGGARRQAQGGSLVAHPPNQLATLAIRLRHVFQVQDDFAPGKTRAPEYIYVHVFVLYLTDAGCLSVTTEAQA